MSSVQRQLTQSLFCQLVFLFLVALYVHTNPVSVTYATKILVF